MDAKSLDPPEPSTLRFDSHQDALDFVRHREQHDVSLCTLNIAKRYVNGDLCLVVKTLATFHPSEFDIIFRAIPDGGFPELDGPIPSGSLDMETGGSCCHQGQECVFACVTQVIEGVEKIIPSFVRLESAQKRLDFRRDIFRSTPHAIIEFGRFACEGEGGLSRIDACLSEDTCPGDIIENGSKMFDDFGRKNSPMEWQPLSKLEFVDFVNSIKIRLSNASAGIFHKKTVKTGIELNDFLVCAVEP